MIGRTIGNYVVREKVGSGGMGSVWLAEHPRIKRRVAIKVLRSELADDPEAVARFFTEARSANEIRNEHIIEILDFGEFEGGAPYLIMEWLEGRTLTQYLAHRQRPSMERIVHILGGISDALGAAHARGVIHRDLKPDNIFLVRKGPDHHFVKVLDFGIAKLLDQQGSAFKTKTNTVIGTPAYMSPEQCRSAHEEIDQRSDVYSLGVIAYQMVTGRLPFEARNVYGMIAAHTTEAPPSPGSIDPAIPELVERVVLRALEKDRDRRYQHAVELVNELCGAAGLVLPESTWIPSRPSGEMPSVKIVQPQPSIWNSDTMAHNTPEPLPAVSPPPNRPSGPPSEMKSGKVAAPPPSPDTLGTAASEVVVAAPRSPLRRGLVYGATVAGVLAVGLGVFIVVASARRQPNAVPPSIAAAPAPAPAPAPVAAPAPAPVAAPAPAPAVPPANTVTISIRTEPPGAEILLDDAPLPNPFSGSFPASDLRRRVVVKKQGYRPSASWEIFDRDRVLEVQLKAASGGVVGAPAPASAREKPPAQPPAVRSRPMHTDDVIIPEWEKDSAKKK